MKKLLLILSMLLIAAGVFAQSGGSERVITFKFVPGEDMFYIPRDGNDLQLNLLYSLVDKYRQEIISGKMPVHVDGYSSSMRSAKRNLELAFIRANRVKSELITRKGLVEDNFVTRNFMTTYEGHKDIVVVTLRIPVKEEPEQDVVMKQPEREDLPVREEPKREEPVVEKKEEVVVAPATKTWREPYCFAIRTNVLYDAFLTPTLGVEWRINHNVGIKLDGSLAWWGNEKGKIQKMWLVSPEVRWYMGDAKRFYLGLGGNYGEYNTYGYLLGNLWPDDTGYQGKLYGGGLTVGYQARLTRHLSLDLNLGMGYTKLEYDSFTVQNETRIYQKKEQSKNFWGPTQAGINLVWTFGQNK